MADVQSPEATLCASALPVLVLPHSRFIVLSLNDSHRLSDKIILCQSTRSVETEPGLVHAGELIVWEWLSYDRLYNDPNNPPPSWETGRALVVCPLQACSDPGAQLMFRNAMTPVRPHWPYPSPRY